MNRYEEIKADRTVYQCEVEDCEAGGQLWERYHVDEEGNVYYTIKCAKHYKEEDERQDPNYQSVQPATSLN